MDLRPPATANVPRPFLGVNFVACRVYGRLYKNADGTAYEGRCPRCGRVVKVGIAAKGIDQRFFLYDCGP